MKELKGRADLGELVIDGRVNMQMDKEIGWECGLALSAVGQEPITGCCEHIT